MFGDELFTPIFVTDDFAELTGSAAWVTAMLDAEAALAQAEGELGLIPADAAADINAVCADRSRFVPSALGHTGRGGGNPVIPLTAALAEALPPRSRSFVHWGATSQDILDTAAVLVARRSVEKTTSHLNRLAEGCAAFAERHRDTPMTARTVLQPAVPTTFGLKAAGWLCGVLDTHRTLTQAAAVLAAQLGGAGGTLASLGPDGPAVLRRFAELVDLEEPTVPWHTARQRIVTLGAALGIVTGTSAKIALDVALLMQAEVAEAAEPAGPDTGGSSAMPQKQNPIAAVTVLAAARRSHALLPVLFQSLVAEHERALGGWHAEWQTLSELLALAGSCATRTADTIEGLDVRPEAMTSNLRRAGGSLVAERISLALAGNGLTRSEAHDHVADLTRRARVSGGSFADEARRDPLVAKAAAADGMDALLDPSTYLGAATAFVDRALARRHEGL